VPFSSAGRTFNQSTDPFQREARGFMDRIKANTPGMSGDLPVRQDWVTGEEIETPSYLLGFLREREGDNDTVSQELRRLGYGFSGPDRKIGQITLSSEQYQEWSRLMGTVTIDGKTLEQQMQRVMQMAQVSDVSAYGSN